MLTMIVPDTILMNVTDRVFAHKVFARLTLANVVIHNPAA